MTQFAHATEFRITVTEKVRTTNGNGKRSMTKLGGLTMLCCLLLGLLVLAPRSWAQARPPILEKVAKTYGIDSWDQVQAIRYTWNAEITGLFKASHVWEWEPKTGKISYEGKDKDGNPVKATYVQSQLNSAPANVKEVVAPAFVNDNYWLIFPFHAYWDTSATVTEKSMQKLPIGAGSADLVSIKYPAELGGYTPGDTWDLYVGKDNRVTQFVYHRGGEKPPHLVTATWTGYKKAGPILFSTEHRGTADGKPLHIFISNISVKLAGSDTWIAAK
jgi:hypothetical protein